MQKVNAVMSHIDRSYPDMNDNYNCIDDLWRPHQKQGDITFCCVDSMAVRNLMWECCKEKSKVFIDSRMAGENMQIIAIDCKNAEDVAYYPTTLFTDAEAYQDACTSKSTYYCALGITSWMIHQMTRWMRGFKMERDMQIPLLAADIIKR